MLSVEAANTLEGIREVTVDSAGELELTPVGSAEVEAISD